MGTGRTFVGAFSGFLVVLVIVFACLVVLFAIAFGLADDAGQNGDADQLSGFLVPVLIAAGISAAVMYFSIRGLGGWATESPDNRTATVVAVVATGVFCAAVVTLLLAEVLGYLNT